MSTRNGARVNKKVTLRFFSIDLYLNAVAIALDTEGLACAQILRREVELAKDRTKTPSEGL